MKRRRRAAITPWCHSPWLNCPCGGTVRGWAPGGCRGYQLIAVVFVINAGAAVRHGCGVVVPAPIAVEVLVLVSSVPWSHPTQATV